MPLPPEMAPEGGVAEEIEVVEDAGAREALAPVKRPLPNKGDLPEVVIRTVELGSPPLFAVPRAFYRFHFRKLYNNQKKLHSTLFNRINKFKGLPKCAP